MIILILVWRIFMSCEDKVESLKKYCLKEAYFYDSLRFSKPNSAGANQRYMEVSEAYIRVCRKIDELFQ